MVPGELTAESFSKYPAQARALAGHQIDLLRSMPLAFLPLLLREVISFDWKFPVEQRELQQQFDYLHGLSEERLQAEMHPFETLQLNEALRQVDWVNEPARFSEQLSAHLWATHQIEAFRKASIDYVANINQASTPVKPAIPRLTMVVMGYGVQENRYRLFRKLRSQGTYFSNVDAGDGRAVFVKKLAGRAAKASEPYGHWYVDGAGAPAELPADVTRIAYQSLDQVRGNLVNKMRQTMQPGGGGPEALRTMMAQMSPQEIGLSGDKANGLLSRFEVSLLTEGSGTQLFSTTFVQWTAREVLRRAQPLTLLTCYAPRQRESSMLEMLSGTPHQAVPDPHGSLIDADMGAYYTWINQQRLPGASDASFLAWFEGHREAMAVGPAFARSKEDPKALRLQDLVDRVT